ncbi:MAG: aconitate hydratase AcnA [Gemmatimonadetes bacterium]|nr:aconitate hydratase AcnA [Gemmatimonadota bacterium]NNM05112.1 aconitate hydratase AcnA [Gemmatimonadota bacterium]
MASSIVDPFGALAELDLSEGPTSFYRLPALEEEGLVALDALPFSIRVLLENTLRHAGRGFVREDDVKAVASWSPANAGTSFPFMPSRVVLQDFTGVPAVVDLASMRTALASLGGDPKRINPVVPADLVIDHSVQVDYYGTADAFQKNVDMEFERNRERYALLRWAQEAFEDFRVVPPGTGIVHQVNLEYLASVVHRRDESGRFLAYPDTLVGTDSHTTMINGLGVVGWGVGGIEAEAVLLGQPYYMLLPEVVGVRLSGALPEGSTATDLVLRVVEMLREHGVVGRFVEYYGPGLSNLTLPDRATLANMSPEYGATIGFFPVDDVTLGFLAATGRGGDMVERVERVSKEMGLFRTDGTPDPRYTSVLELDMSTIDPSVAGPKRPQDRISLANLKSAFGSDLPNLVPTGFSLSEPEDGAGVAVAQDIRRSVMVDLDGQETAIEDGSIVIAAITSCTNTSNPSVMVGAGLLAKKAVERGMMVKPWVKTSLAPGSQVVTDYLTASGLLPYLEKLKFQVVGYGCTTCIGNSGPLPEGIQNAVVDNGLVVTSILSGNRNFEARVHSNVRANYLASPILVVAFALAGRIDLDIYNEPLGQDSDGNSVFLADIWPSQEEIRDTIVNSLKPEMFEERYGSVFDGDAQWQALPVPEESSLYDWDPESTYIQDPPFFQEMGLDVPALSDIQGAKVLASLGRSVTTDHISPAGAIPKGEPAGRYLQEKGVEPYQFNTFGARRGNHEVMMRGTFGNVRIRNLLLEDKEGGYTLKLPEEAVTSIYQASMDYQAQGTPLLVFAGKEYGTGSSRDWAAKGTALLGVKAVVAESFERIHRSNLVGMGVLPLQFEAGETLETLGLSGRETFDVIGIEDQLEPRGKLTVRAHRKDGSIMEFKVDVRLDSQVEIEYYQNGGILHTVLRKMATGQM